MPERGSKTSTVPVVWATSGIFFGAIQMISCRNWWTMDEIWLYHWPGDKATIEWRNSGSHRPKKFQVQKSAGKVIASIFWDQDGIILIDYLPKGQTVNAEYYSSLLVQLKDTSKEKRRGKFTKGVLFLHDNASAHRPLATQKKQAYLGFQCLDHLPYSPDLAPSDYHLFLDWENNWKVAIFRPTRMSLLPRRLCLMDNFLIFFWGGGLAKVRATG